MKASKKNNQAVEVNNNAVAQPLTERQSLRALCKQLREKYGTEEQLESILSSCQTIMSHMEFVTGYTSLQFAGDNEQYRKIYGLNCLVFTELAARAQGKTQRNPNPLMK